MKNDTHFLPCGFTLPELALVLLITALLAGGGSLVWQGWREQQQLAETATGLQLFLAGVREYANRTNHNLPPGHLSSRRYLVRGHPPSGRAQRVP